MKRRARPSCLGALGAGLLGLFRQFAVAAALASLLGPLAAASVAYAVQPVDVVFVLDNSGSMRDHDPDFLTRAAVVDFAAALADDPNLDGRLSIVLFDDRAELVQPLREISTPRTDPAFDRALDALDFSGQRTNSPAGIERALYELRQSGRADARQAIVLLSDGKIDTGDARRDIEAGRSLREDLAAESEASGIRIFGVAFTDAADYALMQALARRTQASYYRAFEAAELASVVDDVLAKVSEPDSENTAFAELPLASAPLPSVEPTPPTPPTPRTPPVSSGPNSGSEGDLLGIDERLNSRLIGLLPVAVLLTGAALLWRRRAAATARRRAEADAPPAQLLDFGGHVGATGSTLSLTRGRTRIGRDPNNDIVFDDDTISSEHAIIEVEQGRYWLEDRRSTNGTRLGDRRLEAGERVQLKGGDLVRFAEIELKFVLAGYVPGGQTVFISTSTSPPPGWSAVSWAVGDLDGGDDHTGSHGDAADETAEYVAIASPPESDDRLPAIATGETDAAAADPGWEEEASPGVLDLDVVLSATSSDEAYPHDDADDEAGDATGRGADERLDPPSHRADPHPADADTAPQRIAVESRHPHISLLPDPEPEPEQATTPEFARGNEAAASFLSQNEQPTEIGAEPAESAGEQRELATPVAAYRDCLDYHVARVAEISPEFAAFIERGFDDEIRGALSVTAKDLLSEARATGRLLQKDYTANRIRYMICAVPAEMEHARAFYVEAFGGFTRLLTEKLGADSFRADRCEILAVLTFGEADAPWVSLSIVPDEGQDPRIDLLSYEFLTDEERHEIDPEEKAEISQSGIG